VCGRKRVVVKERKRGCLFLCPRVRIGLNESVLEKEREEREKRVEGEQRDRR
jgi:hypothetical protein